MSIEEFQNINLVSYSQNAAFRIALQRHWERLGYNFRKNVSNAAELEHFIVNRDNKNPTFVFCSNIEKDLKSLITKHREHNVYFIYLLPLEKILGLPSLYENGLLSHFVLKTGSEKEFIHCFDSFSSIYNKLQNYEKIAYSYLYPYLKEAKMSPDAIALATAMLNRFSESEYALDLASIYFDYNQYHKGREMIELATKFGGSEVKAKIDIILKDHPTAVLDSSFMDICSKYGLKKALVVENDTATSEIIVSVLKAMGFTEVEVSTKLESAFNFVSEYPYRPEFVIFSTNIPSDKLSPTQFVQRLKPLLPNSLFITLNGSNSVNKGTQQILLDYHIFDSIRKPLLSKEDTERTITLFLNQFFAPTKTPDSAFYIIEKMETLLKSGNTAEAENLKNDAYKTAKLRPIDRTIIEAITAFYLRRYSEVETYAKQYITAYKGLEIKPMINIDLLILYSKALYKQNKKEEARNVLKFAKDRSPNNIKVLLLLAEYSALDGNEEFCDEILTLAHDYDSGNEQVIKHVMAKELKSSKKGNKVDNIIKNDPKRQQQLGRIASNEGVALISEGNFDDALALYDNAISYLKGTALINNVIYNKALCLLRRGDDQETVLTLLREIEAKETLKQKVDSLIEKIEKAMKEGKRHTLSEGVSKSSDRVYEMLHEIDQSNYCLKNIYKPLFSRN
jgi:tetratricopeptide (TPR) repeat protein